MLIGITGVPGSAKTSLARALTAKMRTAADMQYRNVELVEEYAREYICNRGAPKFLWEQYNITRTQAEWEDRVPASVDYVITDSPLVLGLIYGEDLVDRANVKETQLLVDYFNLVNRRAGRYDLIIHMGTHYVPDVDGVRPEQHLDTAWRKKKDTRIIHWLEFFKMPYKTFSRNLPLNQLARMAFRWVTQLKKVIS
jgi:nicotinamide riboside kinase